MLEKFRHWVSRDDAVSPVIGTILMVAVTVVLGATVYAALNQFGSNSTSEPVNAAFRVQAVDTDDNGKTDSIRITYVSGPSDVANDDVTIGVSHANDTAAPTAPSSFPDPWNAGDSVVYNANAGGNHFVTITMLGSMVYDQAVAVNEAKTP